MKQTPGQLVDSILFALDDQSAERAMLLSIAFRIVAEAIPDANFESGMGLRDPSDVRYFLLECADAARKRGKKWTVPA